MIHYQLQCGQSHGFDGWFKDSASFEKQAKRGLIECPECGGTDVERALMAPAVAKRQSLPVAGCRSAAAGHRGRRGGREEYAVRVPAKMLAALQRMRAEVEKTLRLRRPGFCRPGAGDAPWRSRTQRHLRRNHR